MPSPTGSPARRTVLERLAWLAVVLMACGLLASAAWMDAKAFVAQWLIERSWEQRHSAPQPLRPWPWADTWASARLEVPALGLSRIVMKDASGESLAFGPGVVPLGEGGQGGSVGSYKPRAVAGHRDTHFAFLEQLEVGDRMTLESRNGELVVYEIASTLVLDARTEALEVPVDGAGLLLITCWPFDAVDPGGPLRYVVQAYPVPGAPRDGRGHGAGSRDLASAAIAGP